MNADLTQIRDTLLLLFEPGSVYEIRMPKTGRTRTVRGYFDNVDAAVDACATWSGKAAAVYVTLNPVNPALLARCANRLEPYAETTSNDSDVLCRRWLLVDIDPTRPSGISASEDELEAAKALGRSVARWLATELDWPKPAYALSGNGAHLLYRIALPNDDASTQLVQRCLQTLAQLFDNAAVTVDTTVFNASRISKVYGTLAAKGDSTPERPHRLAQLLTDPTEPPTPVTDAQLKALTSRFVEPEEKPKPARTATPSGDNFFEQVNDAAMQQLSVWVPALFGPKARPYQQGFRVRSKDLNRSLEEDLSLQPGGIRDFGTETGLTPVDTVLEFGTVSTALEAADWLAQQLGIERPHRKKKAAASSSQPQRQPARADGGGGSCGGGGDSAGELDISSGALWKFYTVIHGTGRIWDCQHHRVMSLDALKLTFGAGLVTTWLKSPERRTIDQDNLVFEPGATLDPVTHINIYTGLDVTPDPSKACSKLIELLMHLCGYDEVLHEWVLRWIAYPLQNPGAKMQTSLVMYGAEGTGKNLFWESIATLYGRYGLVIGQAEIESSFNGWASGKLFAVADEVVSRQEARHIKGKLKALVTGARIMIDEKNHPVREERNHMNTVFLSNELRPLVIDPGDRRYAVIRCDEIKPPDYYEAVGDEIDAGGLEGLLALLLAYPMEGFNRHAKPPRTEARSDLIRLSLPPPDAFLTSWLEQDDDLPPVPLPVRCCAFSDLFRACTFWVRAQKYRSEPSSTDFGARVKRLAKGHWFGRVFTGPQKCYVFGDCDPTDTNRIKNEVIAFKAQVDAYLDGEL